MAIHPGEMLYAQHSHMYAHTEQQHRRALRENWIIIIVSYLIMWHIGQTMVPMLTLTCSGKCAERARVQHNVIFLAMQCVISRNRYV